MQNQIQNTIETPDAWLYNRLTLKWILEPSLNKQLPFLYKIFSWYYFWYFKINNTDYLNGGRRLFQFLSMLLSKASPDKYLLFQLPQRQVFLDPFDGRFFQVVNELDVLTGETKVLNSLLSEGDTFIDIGANHGSFSIVRKTTSSLRACATSARYRDRLSDIS